MEEPVTEEASAALVEVEAMAVEPVELRQDTEQLRPPRVARCPAGVPVSAQAGVQERAQDGPQAGVQQRAQTAVQERAQTGVQVMNPELDSDLMDFTV